ncbi:hypothetical protein ACH5RR_031301 [Cinchona calisaya]|uniref:Uncharacterized protein n=1 Tax=Cinchona calisaya TaxID=153742 RepID=A0ABD2YET5_9GENT
MVSLFSVKMCLPTIPNSFGRHKAVDQSQFRCFDMLTSEGALSRRQVVLGGCGGISVVSSLVLNWVLEPIPAASAGEESNGEEDKDDGVVGAIKSLFDPNEKTKSGKLLPKAYLNSAREVVKTLCDSLKEDPKDVSKFRRTADAAKESIRDYINNWKGQKTVMNEESYVLLEKAIRSLANFYSRAGPSAPLPEEIKSEILGDLNTAEEFL